MIQLKFILQVFLHVFQLIIKLDLNSVTGDFIEGNVDSHGEVVGIVVFDGEKGVVGDVIVVLDGEEDEDAGGLDVNGMVTRKARMVKQPPVVEVSYCSVWIFLKKSNDFSMVLHELLLSIDKAYDLPISRYNLSISRHVPILTHQHFTIFM